MGYTFEQAKAYVEQNRRGIGADDLKKLATELGLPYNGKRDTTSQEQGRVVYNTAAEIADEAEGGNDVRFADLPEEVQVLIVRAQLARRPEDAHPITGNKTEHDY